MVVGIPDSVRSSYSVTTTASASLRAVALNCPQGTVKSRLHYALRKLSEILTAYSPAQSTLNPSAPPPSRHGDQLVECIVRPAQNLKANWNETE